MRNLIFLLAVSFVYGCSSNAPKSEDANQAELSNNNSGVVNEVSPKESVVEYEYVDLGLPSGLLWATCNVGASKPTEYGDYFAWGETTSKETYDWNTYKWSEGTYETLTKYCKEKADGLQTLLPEDDAAAINWGGAWRMPTRTEQSELKEGCTWEWTSDYMGSGVAGSVGTSKANKNVIFFPAGGNKFDEKLGGVGAYGHYWLSSLSVDYMSNAWTMGFEEEDNNELSESCRNYGRSVRAVRER